MTQPYTPRVVRNRGRSGGLLCLIACLVLVAGALSACADTGDEVGSEPTTSSTPTESPDEPASTSSAPEGTPTCAEIWEDGSKIPRGYQGCTTEAGEYVKRDALGCSSGQRLIRYDDRYYGVVGGTVHEAAQPLDDDREYRATVRGCRA